MQQPQENPAPLKEPEKLIIVTGFGPFVGHEEVNASWEAVQLLPDHLNFNGTSYRLEKQHVSVEYEAVDKAVTEIWTRKPDEGGINLVIHCGVHGHAKCIHVEKLAYNHKFRRPDYAGKHLKNGSVCLNSCNDGRDDVIHCGLNVDRIVAAIADTCSCMPGTTEAAVAGIAQASKNVGDYLCGYIYLKSLDVNRNRALFVHVPPVDSPLSTPQTSEIILQIVTECVRQIEDMKNTC